ncbi:MAG: hypothetical protein L0G99_17580, partial [Propionibacteriales bacterium]|nr:hypothetical protein [Propionibacteriales bacterium]
DWAFPALGAPWLDLAILFADVIASGAEGADGGGVEVIELWQQHPVTAPYEVELMICLVVAIGVALHVGANRPPATLFPHQRGWERAMADGIAPFIERHR